MAERQKQKMKREWEDTVLCHQCCKFLLFTASERNLHAKSPSHDVVVLLAVLRNVPQLVPGHNSTNISM